MWKQIYVGLGYLLKVSLFYHLAYLADSPQRAFSVTLPANVPQSLLRRNICEGKKRHETPTVVRSQDLGLAHGQM